MASDSKVVLVVEDQDSLAEMLEVALRKWGYKSKFASTLREGIAALERGKVDIVLSDIKLPDGSGVDLLTRSKTLPEKPPILLMTAFGNTDSAVDAMKIGAFHYITKPFKLEDLKNLLDQAAKNVVKKSKNEPEQGQQTASAEEPKGSSVYEGILGESKPVKEMTAMIQRVAKTKTNVLITGESGTGKELVARAIHYGGPLKEAPFVAVNCGAIPENLIESELFGHKRGSFTGAVNDKEGLFSVATGGTIFLDEIGELPMAMQVKLLRVLQDKTVRPVGGNENIKIDVRVVSATNRNLEEGVAKKTFREDLYYRLNVIHIKAPALRDRRDDIPLLAEHFFRKYSLTHGKKLQGFSEEALAALCVYEFPGNVRELENIVERAVALEGNAKISLESLPHQVTKKRAGAAKPLAPTGVMQDFNAKENAARALKQGPVDLEKLVGEIEKEYLVKALELSGGVKKKAAELLNLSFRSIRYRIKKYGIIDVEGDEGLPDEDFSEEEP